MPRTSRFHVTSRRVSPWMFACFLAVAAFGPALVSTFAPPSGAAATAAPAPTRALTDSRPLLTPISGIVTSVGDGMVGIKQSGQDFDVGFLVGFSTTIVRAGTTTTTTGLRAGDSVEMVVDGRTGQILFLQAVPPASPIPTPSGSLALLAAIGWLAGAAALLVQAGVLRRPALLAEIASLSLPRLLGARPRLTPVTATVAARSNSSPSRA